jgi:ribosomal protein S9
MEEITVTMKILVEGGSQAGHYQALASHIARAVEEFDNQVIEIEFFPNSQRIFFKR